MKKTILTTLFILLTQLCFAQQRDTLNYFYLHRSYYNGISRLGYPKEYLERARIYDKNSITSDAQYYETWSGDIPRISEVSDDYFMVKDMIISKKPFIGTDYYQVHLAKEYFDVEYKIDLMLEGGDYWLELLKMQDNDYLEVLQRAKNEIEETDFFIMLGFAKRQGTKIGFFRFKGDDKYKNYIYLMLYNPENIKKYEFLKIISAEEIPKELPKQRKFYGQ